jgi:hypothetical protein
MPASLKRRVGINLSEGARSVIEGRFAVSEAPSVWALGLQIGSKV